MLLWASLWIGDRVKLAREARPLPPPGSPNVLLIVMDTVAAGHLSLHGYSRATSPTLVQLAQQGIQFDLAWAASSWTLPSHATMFTGRWMHELSTGWFTPLDRTHPTLAEFLGRRGYATAGFIANWFYCGTDSGLARGFTVYQDYIFSELAAFKAGVLVRQSLDSVHVVVTLLEDWLESTGLMPYVQRIWQGWTRIAKGRRPSIASSLTGSRSARRRSAVLRFLELQRCSSSLFVAGGECSSFRGRAQRRLSAHPDPKLAGARQNHRLIRGFGICH